MLLIAGLGNPGRQYAGHRHNIGFMAADAISRRHSFSPWSKKFNALVSEGMLDGRKAVLIKPQTYMNNSGQAIGEAMRFYKLTAADLIVFYDELDLAPGKLRVKHGGGHGGHNGIKSINAHCGADYRRVRIGIGHPGDKARVNGHVLSDFAKADQQWLEPLLDAIADNIAMLAGGNDSAFMNKASVAVQSKAPTSGKEASKPAPKGQSHIPQARSQTSTPPPAEGPMTSMLKRLFGEKK